MTSRCVIPCLDHLGLGRGRVRCTAGPGGSGIAPPKRRMSGLGIKVGLHRTAWISTLPCPLNGRAGPAVTGGGKKACRSGLAPATISAAVSGTTSSSTLARSVRPPWPSRA